MASQTLEIGLLIYKNSMISAIYGLTDLFRIANDAASRHEGIQRPSIRVSHWQYGAESGEIECIYDTHADLPHDLVHVILPPSIVMPMPEQATDSISRWLRKQHSEGTTMCSVCAGSFLLAEAGLLKNRQATTHWLFSEMMATRFPDTAVDTNKMIVDDGDIITAGGIMAWTDLGLRLVQRIMGPTLMLETARFLLVDPPGREQRFYSSFVPNLRHGDASILKVQHWLQINGAREVTLPMMADHAGMEERTFLRRFQKATGLKPTEYCQQLRVSKAREMLEFTHNNIEQVAWAVGYEDPGAFRKVFHKVMGLTPGDYRHRFSLSSG